MLIDAGGLRLVACTLAHAEAELESHTALAELLHVGPPSRHWPPGEYDREAQLHFRDKLRQGGEAAQGWYGWYGIVPGQAAPSVCCGRSVLVGACGYFGPPDENGGVALGYSVLPECTGQGLATRMAALLVERAFSFAGVARITAETTPDNIASQCVLRKLGFQLHGSQPVTGPDTGQPESGRQSGSQAGTGLLSYVLSRRA